MPEAVAGDAPGSIAILRALQLGDMLCAVPALRALRARFDRARMTLIGLPWARAFASRFRSYVDDFMEFPGYPGLPERPFDGDSFRDFLGVAHDRHFDTVVQLHGSGRIANPLAGLLGARSHAGYYRPGDFRPESGTFLAWNPNEHEILRCIRLAAALGAPAQGLHLEFPLDESDFADYSHVAENASLQSGRFLCLHPGSQLPSRRWPAEHFALVGDAAAAMGLRVVITGIAAERDLARNVARVMRHPATVLAGETSLGALAILVREAAAVVCNDTGISHIAAAMRTPSVVVCCGADPLRWAPLDASLHRVLHAEVECRPCAHVTCPIDHPCATRVRPVAAESALEALLASRPPVARRPSPVPPACTSPGDEP